MWTSANSPESLVPVRRNLMSPLQPGSIEVLGGLLDPFERADVPEHHRARAVSRGDHALELAVIDGVILGLDGEALLRGIEARTPRNRPREQDAVVLEAEVEMHARGPVFLHAEAVNRGAGAPRPRRSPSARRAGSPLGSGVCLKSRFRRYSSRVVEAMFIDLHGPGRNAERTVSFTFLMLVQRTAQGERSQAARLVE